MSGVTGVGDAQPRTPGSAARSLAELESSFEDAATAVGIVGHDLRIADRRVRLQFAGSALVPAVVPAFAHLVVDRNDGDEPVLTVRIWDAASTGTAPVQVPAGATGTEAGPRYHSERDGLVMDAVDATLTVHDTDRGVAVHYVPDPHVYQWYHRASPLKELLHAWAIGHGLHFVHAAAVGSSGAGVLVTGTAGKGKSTTSLACAAAGLDYAGDDYVLVDPERLAVHSLYRSARLGWHTVERFPGLLEPTNAPPDDKALGFVPTPGAAVAGFSLAAVLVPTATGRAGTTVVEINPAQALLALAPSTVLQLPGGQLGALRAARRILEGVPTYALEAGTDLQAVAAAVRALLDRHGLGSSA